jgi:NADP-dependent 3-hydroxy acid dehydrogenase YdfG
VAFVSARSDLCHRNQQDDWRSTVDGTLTATFLTLKHFLPGMLQSGRGSVVTMGL